jgi:hypothetical protein
MKHPVLWSSEDFMSVVKDVKELLGGGQTALQNQLEEDLTDFAIDWYAHIPSPPQIGSVWTNTAKKPGPNAFYAKKDPEGQRVFALLTFLRNLEGTQLITPRTQRHTHTHTHTRTHKRRLMHTHTHKYTHNTRQLGHRGQLAVVPKLFATRDDIGRYFMKAFPWLATSLYNFIQNYLTSKSCFFASSQRTECAKPVCAHDSHPHTRVHTTT